MKPLAIDLFCGLGGWTEGLLAEGYYVVGFDIEQHVYGEHRYPAQLVIQDVLTLHGSQFRDAALIVASPPCQGYSYRAMPFNIAHNTTSGVGQNPDGRLHDEDHRKCGGDWFDKVGTSPMHRGTHGSRRRKFASAQIAKIPSPLARHIARTYFPSTSQGNP